MALNRLTNAQMISLTKDWVKPGTPERIAMERVPVIKALMPHMEDTAARLLTAERVTLTMDKDELKHLLGTKDACFDDLVRGIIFTLDGQIFLAKARGDHELAHRLETFRDFLMPNGLKTVSLAYREEAGQTDLAQARLKPEHRNFLQSIPVIGGTLLDKVNDWIQAGQELGQLEDERADIVAPTRVKSAVEARSMWIQMIHTIRSVVRMARIEDPVILEALHRIERAEAAADAAAERGEAPVEDAEPPPEDSEAPAEDGETPSETSEAPAEEPRAETDSPVDEPA